MSVCYLFVSKKEAEESGFDINSLEFDGYWPAITNIRNYKLKDCHLFRSTDIDSEEFKKLDSNPEYKKITLWQLNSL
ncbi:MAG: hypothetical protein ABIF08_03015 [Nanoarchaeota archaeon]